MSSAVAATVPTGPVGFYRQLRAEGHDHDSALRSVCHSYGRSAAELGSKVEPVRAEIDAAPGLAIEPDEAVVAPEPDPFDAQAEAVKARIADLSGRRPVLALDALHDASKAAPLKKVEQELRDAGSEYERVELARREQQRRDAAQAQQAQKTARNDAQARADHLGGEAAKAWSRVEAAAAAFAEALAVHEQLAADQAVQLTDAGHREAGRCRQQPGQIKTAVAQACRDARADLRWIAG